MLAARVARRRGASPGRPRVAGTGAIRRILRSRLPERFAGKLPPLLVEIVVGVAIPVLLALARLALVPLTGEQAPFALVFVGVVAAAMLAGWRSGLLALVVGQLLTWYLVIERNSADFAVDYLAGLLLAALAQLMALVIIALYQREIDAAWSKQEAQMDLLQKALREIDHRTTNNYQTVLALILAQAKRAENPAVKAALQQAADRITAISQASRKLAPISEGLEEVRVGEQLPELIAQIERGLSRPGIALECEYADVSLPPNRAVWLSVLVNELVTNALKHAFPDDRPGKIRVSLQSNGEQLDLRIEDDGVGIRRNARTRGSGLGNQLVTTFTRQLRAVHEVTSGGDGTRHRIRIPATP